MSITAVRLQKRSGAQGDNGWDYTDIYQVESDSVTEAIADLAVASFGGTAIPAYGTAHYDDSSATVRSKQVDRTSDASRLVWKVSVGYQYPDRNTPQADPLDDDPTIDWGHRFITEVVYRDKNGAAILNSAGYPFDPTVEIERPILTLRVTRNEGSYDAELAHAFVSTLNSTATTICGLGISAAQGKVVNISGSKQERNGTDYYAVTYELEFREDTWAVPALDQGMHTSNGDAVLNDDGSPAQTPKLLNGSGVQTTTPYFLSFEVLPTSNFAALNLNIAV